MAYGFPSISCIGYPVSLPCPGHAGLGFREVGPGDGAGVLAHLERLTPDDRHLRFCGTVKDDGLARHVAGIWEREGFALGAFDGPLWDGPFHRAGPVRALVEIAIAGEVAEFAISVDAEHRRAGVGTYLLQTAARLVALRGTAHLVAVTSPGNHAMIGLAQASGAAIETDAGETTLTFAVARLHHDYLRRRTAQVLRPPVAGQSGSVSGWLT